MSSKSELVSSHMWEVCSPPPLNSFRGAVIPKALTNRRRRRKVSIEVHKIHSAEVSVDEDSSERVIVNGHEDRTYEECIVRVLEPEKLKSSKRKQQEEDDDERSQDGLVSPDFQGQGDYSSEDCRGWKVKWRFPITAMTIKGSHRATLIMQIRLGEAFQLRELIFDSVAEAEAFRKELERQHGLEGLRREMRLQAQLGDQLLIGDEQITFLVEIVSGWNIPVGDEKSSDPYVKCTFNGSQIHKTKFISKTLDPIWTLKTDSLFLWTVNAKELFLSDGLHCFLWDFDKIAQDDVLAWISVPPYILYGAEGERMEFKLHPPPGSNKKEVPGYLAIRCRRASEYDKRFMKEYAEAEAAGNASSGPLSLKHITKLATESQGGSSNVLSLIRQNKRVLKDKNDKSLPGVKQYRVRPGPDPRRVDETTWLTKEQIEEECRKDSFKWVDAGSGRLGRVFLEVLGCDGLPNLDTGGLVGNKTDTFVAVVFEDTVVNTDVIDDSLSPRWMPWSKRAFIFHIYHSSQVFLGVFDFDDSSPSDDHDLVGRVTLDLGNFRKDTTYTLKYNIYTTARMSDRKAMGSITVRLRLDIEDERQLLLSTLEPPAPIYVNSKKRKDFRVVRYACTGKYDMENYNMKVINSYIEELLAMQHVLFYLQDAFAALLLWRATTTVVVGNTVLKLPSHSLTAFVVAVTLVERPQLLPSAFLFSIAWMLLATMDYRQQLPDIWSRCKSFSELARTLILGESGVPPDNIPAGANYEEAERFHEEWKKRITDAEDAAVKSYEASMKLQEEYLQEMDEVDEGDPDLATKENGLSIDPFKPLLYPVQQNLAMVIRFVRHLKFVIFWEECYISFWVVSGCLLLSLIFLFVPWFFLIKWSARVVVWAVFGPWMKIVDMYYVSKIESPTEEEIESKRREKEKEKKRLAKSDAVREARIKRENNVKLKVMKSFMFGKFVTRVPILKEDRYRDMPLPESTAVPYTAQPVPLSELAMQEAGYHRTRLPGQQLVGDMIPKIESYGFTEAPIGQATAHPRLVDAKGPGGGIHSGPDSTVAAYAKIGSIAVAAAIVTWFGVPVLAALTEAGLQRLVDMQRAEETNVVG